MWRVTKDFSLKIPRILLVVPLGIKKEEHIHTSAIYDYDESKQLRDKIFQGNEYVFFLSELYICVRQNIRFTYEKKKV